MSVLEEHPRGAQGEQGLELVVHLLNPVEEILPQQHSGLGEVRDDEVRLGYQQSPYCLDGVGLQERAATLGRHHWVEDDGQWA